METDEEALKAEKHAKKVARRERQRELNILRASKMQTARLKTPNFPAIKTNLPEINIGCSGWFYWHWRDCFYAKKSQPSEWFAHYADQFKTVELNAPFYSWPTLGTVQTWLKQLGRRRFIYTVKVSELITHVKKFEDVQTLIKDFGHIADLLGKHMGCFLFQLPPSYHFTPTRLKDIIRQLDHSRRNVVEFRHASWWNEDVYAAFREAGTIFCSCSGPRLPDVLVKTADEIYIRFHGKKQWYRHDYTKEELAIWAERIQQSGAKRTWIYFNNDRDCYAIKNARMLKKILTLQR